MAQLFEQSGSEDLVEEEAAAIRSEGQGVRSLPFPGSPTAPALHGSLSEKSHNSTPPWSVSGHENWRSPTHRLLTRDNQSKQKRGGPEHGHGDLQIQTAEATPEDQTCWSGPPCCQVSCLNTAGQAGLPDPSPAHPW